MSEKRWYEFRDNSFSEIVGSYSSQQSSFSERMLELEESDERVRAFLGPEYARKKVQVYKLRTVEDLVSISKNTNSSSPFGFRGQSRADWSLETCIERNRQGPVLHDGILNIYESRILVEAKRRLHNHSIERPENQDLLSWLALVQHYGGVTRLLDISWSVFIAAYFAVQDIHVKVPAAIWMFNSALIARDTVHKIRLDATPFRSRSDHIILADSYSAPTGSPNEPRMYTINSLFPDSLNLDVPLVIQLAIEDSISVPGVLFVNPTWMSKRIESQQGAFLFPLDLRLGFQKNLETVVGESLPTEADLIDFPGEKVLNKAVHNAYVTKFVIAPEDKESLRSSLRKMNLRPSTLFPDIEGLMRDLAGEIPF